MRYATTMPFFKNMVIEMQQNQEKTGSHFYCSWADCIHPGHNFVGERTPSRRAL